MVGKWVGPYESSCSQTSTREKYVFNGHRADMAYGTHIARVCIRTAARNRRSRSATQSFEAQPKDRFPLRVNTGITRVSASSLRTRTSLGQA